MNGPESPERPPRFGEEPARRIADGVLRPLHPLQVKAARMSGWIAFLFSLLGTPVVVLILYFKLQPSALGFAGLVAGGGAFLLLMLFGAHSWPRLEYKHTRWRLDPEGLEIHRGVVWKHTISVPRQRIQHTDVARGPIQRRFGLATLVIHTAGSHNYQINLEGLGYATAFEVRRYLLEEEEDGAPDEGGAERVAQNAKGMPVQGLLFEEERVDEVPVEEATGDEELGVSPYVDPLRTDDGA